ncbi:piggyBac transposable element-derived protein 3-like [Leptopilina boulardi]|uniref:piggyBac transposable element-derived protein 3-like n=1 Tax=Leptopilina boulardi TaxID=63433 RepID=UPI0021F5F994|nr:piggyBac transposable element-derived protein 3-like [Leptopilina boulardi]
MSVTELEVFIGLIIFTMYNQRLSQRDYWSQDPHLKAEPVASAMTRDNFENIKSKIKFHEPEYQNNADREWRVRKLTDIFRSNLIRFGIFSSSLSIDEMMLRFYGRSVLKQFIKGKPVRFGIKLWALCSSNGYLFDFEIYCGKMDNKSEKLANCTLGSRVVINMLQVVFRNVHLRNREDLHIYFDNLFTSPDLLVHLKKYGLVATGTVRANRVNIKNAITEKDERGKWEVKHEKKSGINFITVMDSKPVSLLSTAAGVTPLGKVKRRQKGKKEKKELDFPNAFMLYNQFMGGVDLHDQRCNAIEPIIRSKK